MERGRERERDGVWWEGREGGRGCGGEKDQEKRGRERERGEAETEEGEEWRPFWFSSGTIK